MKFKLNGLNFRGKLIRDLLWFYWLDNKIISCKWKHPESAFMDSNDQYFLIINGLSIFNDRSQKDIAILLDN
jgi:hypothetical protein